MRSKGRDERREEEKIGKEIKDEAHRLHQQEICDEVDLDELGEDEVTGVITADETRARQGQD